ncbi:MAG: hypothetical protein MRZ79_20020 [Bacteroidia bacterium]|nr:hypothetical protein [Bacteroidia bacterium]
MYNRVIRTLILLSVLSLAFTFFSCSNATIDPEDTPEFKVSGSLTVGGESLNLSDWIQGPTTFSAQGMGFSGNIAKEGIGSFTFFVTGINESQLTGTHDLSDTSDNGSLLNIILDGVPLAGNGSNGMLVISKNELLQNSGAGSDIHLVSGNFTIEGTTTSGAAFSINGSFENAQTIFI